MTESAPSSTAAGNAPPSLLWLLIQVNCRQGLRRLKGLRGQSKLLTTVIGLFMAGYLGVAFWLFWSGLHFVARFPGLGSMLLERLLFLMFAMLFGLLLISNLVISYTNLFRNRETTALLTLPVPARTVFQWKFIESTLLASWAFLFLIAPFLAAYGLTRGVAWHFYFITLLLVALFIILPAVAGVWSAMTVARFLDRRVFQTITLTLFVALIAWIMLWLRPEAIPDDPEETRVVAVLDKVLTRTRLSEFPLLPSYWLSLGVLHWTEGARGAAMFFTLVLLSNVLFFGLLTFTRAGRYFYDAASAAQSRGSTGIWRWRAARRASAGMDPSAPGRLERFVALLPGRADLKALAVKDARMFWRDTAQWGQTLMLFGLLAVYILNLRHFSRQLDNPFWLNLVSFLNLGACSLNLATLTTRFIYPQFSLEGRRLWIVGMAPVGLVQVVRAKFWMAAWTSLALTLGLIGLSCHMLDLDTPRTLFFTVAIAGMTFTLNGLAMGLGVLYPNLREDNPGKIVSGFGGTFCLVLSFLYILGSVVLLWLGAPWSRGGAWAEVRSLLCGGAFVGLSLLLGWTPMYFADQRLKTFEH